MPTNRRLQEQWNFSMFAPSRNTNTQTWLQISRKIFPQNIKKRNLQNLSKHHSRTGFVESGKALTPNPRATISCLRRLCSSLLGVICIRNLGFCVVKTDLTRPKGWMTPHFVPIVYNRCFPLVTIPIQLRDPIKWDPINPKKRSYQFRFAEILRCLEKVKKSFPKWWFKFKWWWIPWKKIKIITLKNKSKSRYLPSSAFSSSAFSDDSCAATNA